MTVTCFRRGFDSTSFLMYTGFNMKPFTSLKLMALPALAACFPAACLPITTQPSAALFQVFILSPVTTCLAGNEFISGNVCRGDKCGDCECELSDFDPPSPITGIAPEHINDPQYAGYRYRECFNIALADAVM